LNYTRMHKRHAAKYILAYTHGFV